MIKPGMTLSTDVVGQNGIILAPANCVLSTEIILVFSRNGISLVDVKEINRTSTVTAQTQVSDPEVVKKKELPSITVTISENDMKATLIIEPTEPDNSDLTKEDIKSSLIKSKVVSGIDEKLIEGAVHNWNLKKHRYEISGIATGTLPEPAVEGDIHTLVKHISNDRDAKKIRSCRFIWQTGELCSQVQHVKPGMIVAERLPGTPSVPGRNVKGELIFSDEIIKKNISFGNGIRYSDDLQNYISEASGALSFQDDTIEIIPVNFDGAVDIEIAPNKMKAELIFHRPVEDGALPGEKEVRDVLQHSEINTGIDEGIIKRIITGFKSGIVPEERVTIALGIPPINGCNGKITYHFSTETSLKPKVNPDGSVDYKSVDIVISVCKGEKLATLEPPEKGVPGKNLFGEPLPCMDGTPARLPLGPNTEPDSQNPNILISSSNGIARLVGTAVEVCEGFVINGNVDFSTGNVKYDHSVVVTGDVKSGFGIECGGDLQTGGTIEDCMLRIGGNVLCRFGFCGQGKGLIDAKGDINLGFMKNQTVRSKKNVNIAREAINSTIFAKETIHIHGNPLSVAGGYLTASESITVNSIGNHSGIKTLCEVGFDYTLGEELHALETHLSELVLNQNKIIENIKKIDKTLAFQKRLSLKDQALKIKLNESRSKYDQQIKSLELRKKILEKKMYNFEKVFIKFERTAYPGTLFKFGERHFLVKEEIHGPKTVKLIDFEIKIL
jgi:uncharacterized protein (DUF342 family)